MEMWMSSESGQAVLKNTMAALTWSLAAHVFRGQGEATASLVAPTE
ncbi:MAG: hypothetical protein ACOY46_14150 [Bacillota bacterium]